MKNTNTRVVLLEEKNEAFLIWNTLINSSYLNATGNILLHLDEHMDMYPPRTNMSIHDIVDKNALNVFTYNELSISSFIIPAIYQNIFNKVFWVNNSILTPKKIKRCVRTFNKEGKKFLIYNPLRVPNSTISDYNKYQMSSSNFNDLNVPQGKNLICNINLSYFCNVTNPNEYRVVSIEITEKEFNDFSEDFKYHPLRYEFLNHRISAKEENGKYYYVINDHSEIYSQLKSGSECEIIVKIEQFIRLLKNLNNTPKLITIAKSVKSGYTPSDKEKFVRNELLNRLAELYAFKLENINEYSLKPELEVKAVFKK